jgi:uncharacterized membrane protein
MKKLALTLLCLSVLSLPGFAQYRFNTVDYPGASNTNLYAVNDLAEYVGAYFDATGSAHAILFNGHTLSALDPDGVIGQNVSFALSINNRGQIAGTYSDASGAFHGFLYHGGTVTTLDYPGGFNTEAFGVNDLDEVIGVFFDADQNLHSFVLRKGVYKLADLPNGNLTVPFSVNDLGEIVGEFADVAGTTGHGYLEIFPTRKFTTYDDPAAPANSTYFISINNLNQILGQWVDSNNVFHNFLLSGKKLNTFTLPVSFGSTNTSAQTINDAGEIVGWYADAQGVQHGFTAVRPLPKRK